MSDPYSQRYVFPRHPMPPMGAPARVGMGKRPRFDLDDNVPPRYIPGLDGAYGGNYYGTEGRLTGESYSNYVPGYQPPSYDQGHLARPVMGGGYPNYLNSRPGIALGGPSANTEVLERTMSFETPRVELPFVPSQHNSTLFVEGLPLNSTKREVSHIFRPFGGFKDVRVVLKGPKPPKNDWVMLCFVEFTTPQHAAVAVEALQGYKFDYTDPNSPTLKVNFARHQKPKAGSHGNH